MQRKRKGNDRQAYQSHIKRQEAYERGWLDDADEEYPDYGEAEAYDTEKMAGLVRGQPVVSGYEALERRRGRRKPPRKLTRREKRAMKKAEKMNEKLRREQEKAEKYENLMKVFSYTSQVLSDVGDYMKENMI